jgi:sterol desaturase/sphingolipid hydroxylase (fatty acid hydroxylase superfamily)
LGLGIYLQPEEDASVTSANDELRAGERSADWRPPGLIEHPPLFVWPPQPVGFFKAVFGFPGYLLPWKAFYALIALLVWLFLLPAPSEMRAFAAGWIAWIFGINLALLVVFAGALHFRLYIQRAQGTEYKYNRRWLATDSPNFLFRNQLLDNVFWNVVSAVPILTAYEVLALWAQANRYAPVVSWRAHPAYCVLLMMLIPLFHEIHFYSTHRMIHWPPLYRAVHSVHHHNVNPGPWSGLAMHPVEHLVYFSGMLLFLVVPSSPLHVLFYATYLGLSPSQGHTGFDRLVLAGQTSLDSENYAHYLHHKYFEVNYTDPLIPLDKWFGTFHDGSAKAQEEMNRRVRKRIRVSRG